MAEDWGVLGGLCNSFAHVGQEPGGSRGQWPPPVCRGEERDLVAAVNQEAAARTGW